jgi:hypothetical protein
MSSMLLQYRKPQIKQTTQKPVRQKYPRAWPSNAEEKRKSLVVPAPALILHALAFLGTGGRFGQA